MHLYCCSRITEVNKEDGVKQASSEDNIPTPRAIRWGAGSRERVRTGTASRFPFRQEARHVCGWLGLWRRNPWTWAGSLALTPSGWQKRGDYLFFWKRPPRGSKDQAAVCKARGRLSSGCERISLVWWDSFVFWRGLFIFSSFNVMIFFRLTRRRIHNAQPNLQSPILSAACAD